MSTKVSFVQPTMAITPIIINTSQPDRISVTAQGSLATLETVQQQDQKQNRGEPKPAFGLDKTIQEVIDETTKSLSEAIPAIPAELVCLIVAFLHIDYEGIYLRQPERPLQELLHILHCLNARTFISSGLLKVEAAEDSFIRQVQAVQLSLTKVTQPERITHIASDYIIPAAAIRGKRNQIETILAQYQQQPTETVKRKMQELLLDTFQLDIIAGIRNDIVQLSRKEIEETLTFYDDVLHVYFRKSSPSRKSSASQNFFYTQGICNDIVQLSRKEIRKALISRIDLLRSRLVTCSDNSAPTLDQVFDLQLIIPLLSFVEHARYCLRSFDNNGAKILKCLTSGNQYSYEEHVHNKRDPRFEMLRQHFSKFTTYLSDRPLARIDGPTYHIKNHLREAPVELQKIEYLHLPNAGITGVPWDIVTFITKYMPNVSMINLRGNAIQNIPEKWRAHVERYEQARGKPTPTENRG